MGWNFEEKFCLDTYLVVELIEVNHIFTVFLDIKTEITEKHLFQLLLEEAKICCDN